MRILVTGSFVKAILQQDKGEPLRVVDDQTGSPTFAPDLARKILELAEGAVVGICHVTNSGFCTWFDFAPDTRSRWSGGAVGTHFFVCAPTPCGTPAVFRPGEPDTEARRL